MDKRKNNGGRRIGAGRPASEVKKKSLTFRMDPDVESILNEAQNKSRLINECVRLIAQTNVAGADT